MALQCFDTPIVTTLLTTSAEMEDRFSANFLPTFSNSIDQIFPTISVLSPFCHQATSPYSRPLYQLSYRGTRFHTHVLFWLSLSAIITQFGNRSIDSGRKRLIRAYIILVQRNINWKNLNWR